MAQIIKTNGGRKEIEPKNGSFFSLGEMQKIVGGYIEIAYLGNDTLMIVNEEGKLMGLPINSEATILYQQRVTHDVIVGDVLVCSASQVQ